MMRYFDKKLEKYTWQDFEFLQCLWCLCGVFEFL